MRPYSTECIIDASNARIEPRGRPGVGKSDRYAFQALLVPGISEDREVLTRREPYEKQTARIIDQEHPESNEWQVDFEKTPATSSFSDFAIAARLNDDNTGAPVFVIAGIGRDGTAAAADCVTSKPCMNLVESRIGRGALQKSFEVVLKTNVIAGQRGAPIIEAAYR